MLDTAMQADVETVLECYPRIYFACHRRHVRDEQTAAVLSAHQASVLDHLDSVEGTSLLDLARRRGLKRVAIHAMLDGRDTLPKSALGYMQELLGVAKGRARIASVGGRYFGMDRDKRWDRTKKWYDAAVRGVGTQATDPLDVTSSPHRALAWPLQRLR